MADTFSSLSSESRRPFIRGDHEHRKHAMALERGRFLIQGVPIPPTLSHMPNASLHPHNAFMLKRSHTFVAPGVRQYTSVARSLEAGRDDGGTTHASSPPRLLPPLSHDPLMLRDRPMIRYGVPKANSTAFSINMSQESLDEPLRSSYSYSPLKRVRMDVDRRVVNHLRRELSRRLERRFTRLQLDEPCNEKHTELKETEKKSVGKADQPWDIYGMYSDIGDKIPRRLPSFIHGKPNLQRTMLHRQQQTTRDARESSPRLSGGGGRTECLTANGTNETATMPTTVLSEKQDTKTLVDDTIATTSISDTGVTTRHQGVLVNNKEITDLGKISEKESTKENNKAVQDSNEAENARNYLDVCVSPIPTPSVLKPYVLADCRLNRQERTAAIIAGRLDVECPADDRVIRIYLHSCSSDTEAERTALIEEAYVPLRTACLKRGYDLQLLDPRWGSRDMLTDTHDGFRLASNLIARSAKSPAAVSFITLVSQKYGDTMLPTAISVSDFKALVVAARREQEAQEAEAAEREAAAASQRRISYDDDDENISVARIPEEVSSSSNEDFPEKSSKRTESTEASGVQRKKSWNDVKEKVKMAGKAAMVLSAFKEQTERCDPELLETWYKLDENIIPPAYVLQNISSRFPDFAKSDASKRSQARTAWHYAAQKLRSMLVSLSEKALSPDSHRKFVSSEGALELKQIMRLSKLPAENMLWFQRDIEDMSHHLADEKARDFVDFTYGTNDVDQRKATALQDLTAEKLTHLLPIRNHTKYTVSWGPGGIDPKQNRAHASYVNRLSRDITDAVMTRVVRPLANKACAGVEERMVTEVLEHAKICNKWARELHGRKDILIKLKQYISSSCSVPLVVYGETGCGITALLSRAATASRQWMKGKNTAVIFRSIGATPASQSPRMLLHSLCHQLCTIFHGDASKIPEDYRGLQNDFDCRLSMANPSQQLILILDGLHNFPGDEAMRKPTWLSQMLPNNVRLIVSTAKEEKYPTLRFLKHLLADFPDYLLPMPQIQPLDIKAIVTHWMSENKRNLTHDQLDYLYECMTECPYPLYWKILVAESLNWSSSQSTHNLKLPNSVSRLTMFVFARLERDHGDILVKRTLGYITASRHGLTENELCDLLSLDEAVMDDITTRCGQTLRSFPVFFWLRIKDDLGDKLKECEMDGYIVIKWSHVVYDEVATERYLNQRDKAPSYHKAMAEYFSGIWSDKPKPYAGNDHGTLRHVVKQSIYWEFEEQEHTKRIYNLRTINELPYQLLHSQQFEKLKRDCFCNFEWVLGKLCGTNIHALFEDIQMALQTEPADSDLKLMSDTLHLSRLPLANEPKQLASQMVGRLQRVITADVPIAPADPLKYPFVHPFLNQAKKPSVPSLIPNVTCLTEPGGILFDLLSGHTDEITAAWTTTDGRTAVTASADDTLKVWTLKTGRVAKTIAGVGKKVLSIRLAKTNSLIVTAEVGCIRVWEMGDGKCVGILDDQDDPPIITTAAEGQLLVAFMDGSGTMKVWDLADDVKLVREDVVSDFGQIHQDKSFVVSPISNGSQVLYAVRSSSEATVQNASSGKRVRTLKCREKSASIRALSATKEYWIVGVRCNFMQLHDIHVLDIFDTTNGALLRSIRGCTNDTIDELHVNAIASHALSICCSESSKSSEIAIWNIETEDHKHLAKHAALSHFGACGDLHYCLTAAKGENTLRIWDLSGKINVPVKRQNGMAGIEELFPMVNHPRYIIAKLIGNGALTVWNVLTGKCRGSAVRIEHGLVDPSDVLLIHNTRVIILAEKGFADVSNRERPLFQTVLIYDLRTKKYVRKLTGCYIVPSPAHEYVLLDDDHLMGLSDTRTHFVVWSLQTGHVVHRIKNNFQEFDISRNFSAIGERKAFGRRTATPYMTPWERRSETKTARDRRINEELDHEKKILEEKLNERENGIEQFIISGDRKTVVASFYAHHLCVFDLEKRRHTQVLESPGSMLFLHTAAITYDGQYMVHPNYDDGSKTSYLTLWDCREGHIRRRLRNERNVSAVAISDDAKRIVIGKAPNELRIWEPGRSDTFRRVRGYRNMKFGVESKICIIEEGSRAAVFAGDVSIWDLNKAELLAVFTPDTKIQCFSIAMEGKMLVLGMRDSNEVITLRLVSQDQTMIDGHGENVFGEQSDSSSEEEDEEEEEEDQN